MCIDLLDFSNPKNRHCVAFGSHKISFSHFSGEAPIGGIEGNAGGAATNRKTKTEFKVWSRKSVLNQTRFAAEIGPEVLSYYETFFSIDFPLPKQDMIGIPDFAAGAMENWGLITYR